MVRTLLRNQRGSQIVEFALIMPILLYLVLSVPVFGMIVRARIVVEGAAREGARYMGISQNAAGARDKVYEELVQSGGLKATDGRNGTVLFDRSSDVAIREESGWAVVTVTYRQPTVLPTLGRLIGSRDSLGAYFTIRATARFRSEYDPWR